MPLITVHNFFSKDLLDNCTLEIKNTIQKKRNIYELFAQGFDPFFFNKEFGNKKRKTEIFHNNETDTFFLNFIKNIKKEKLGENPFITAALFGHLAHYVLDSTCHPFVFYKTGEYKKSEPKTFKYKGKHTEMEMHLDAFMYEQRTHTPFYKFKIHKHLITKEKLPTELITILNLTYQQTFQIKNGGKIYKKSCQNMYYAYKFLIEDPTGIKTKIYRFIDKITPKKANVFANYSSYVKEKKENFLNLEHNIWYNPWKIEIKSTDSFYDLYNKALEEGKKLFLATQNFLQNKITEEDYKTILKDKSYCTGLSWHFKEDIKKIEY